MVVLHIEHHVSDYDRWKQVFDADPIDRKGSGVRRYRVARAVDEPDHVVIELAFDDAAAADAALAKLRVLWDGPGREVMHNPSGRILTIVEDVAL